MRLTHQIKEYVLTIPKGQPFAANTLRDFASTENVRQLLNRLVS